MSKVNGNPVLLTSGGIPRKGLIAHRFCDIVKETVLGKHCFFQSL